jgi:hypothetical protein
MSDPTLQTSNEFAVFKMETNKRAQDILEFIIFVGLGEELILYREHEPGLVRECCKVPGRRCWGLVLVPLSPPCHENKRIWVKNQN